MKTSALIHVIFGFTCLYAQTGCAQDADKSNQQTAEAITDYTIDSAGTLRSRFIPLQGYTPLPVEPGSFAQYLTTLPLKPAGSLVNTYNDYPKDSTDIYCAVVDMPIGEKDLHQCADAVMHLRAEYLWQQKRFDEIAFDLTNGFKMQYSEWMQGKRLAVNGNTTTWVQKASPSNTHDDLWAYLQVVFTYAGTLSLSRELPAVPVEEMQIGDVFVFGGTPGHAVIVVDMAIDTVSGKKCFMLAQSYMPAQEIQILINPAYTETCPWYPLEFGDVLTTSSWLFDRNALKRF